MKIEEAIEILREHNRWRRGAEIEMQDPKLLGESIDCILEAFDSISGFEVRSR